MDGTLHEMLLELEYIGFTPKQAQDIILLKHFYATAEKQAEFTSCEMNRLYFVKFLISQGKISEEI